MDTMVSYKRLGACMQKKGKFAGIRDLAAFSHLNLY